LCRRYGSWQTLYEVRGSFCQGAERRQAVESRWSEASGVMVLSSIICGTRSGLNCLNALVVMAGPCYKRFAKLHNWMRLCEVQLLLSAGSAVVGSLEHRGCLRP
jgi:hypothetical protein